MQTEVYLVVHTAVLQILRTNKFLWNETITGQIFFLSLLRQ